MLQYPRRVAVHQYHSSCSPSPHFFWVLYIGYSLRDAATLIDFQYYLVAF